MDTSRIVGWHGIFGPLRGGGWIVRPRFRVSCLGVPIMTNASTFSALPRTAGRRNGRAVPGVPAVSPRVPLPVSTSPADIGLRDPVTAVHDSIDFARAIAADGGTATAGLTMLRGELQHLATEVRRMREEFAAVRQDCERVRLDLVRLSQFTHGLLVDRLATRFQDIDRRLAGLAGVHAFNSGPDFDPGR